MGAGGGICERARAELLRPGLSTVAGIMTSGGRFVGGDSGNFGVDLAEGEAFTTAGAGLEGFTAFTGFAGGTLTAFLGAGFAAVFVALPAVSLELAVAARTGGLTTGARVAAFPFVPEDLTLAVVTGLLLAAGFFAATGFTAFLTAGLAATALPFPAGFAGFAAAFAGVFLAGIFTVGLLWKPLVGWPWS